MGILHKFVVLLLLVIVMSNSPFCDARNSITQEEINGTHIAAIKVIMRKDSQSSTPQYRIHRGYKCPTSKYPFLVAILQGQAGLDIFCGGSLITESLILTAGHCCVSHIDLWAGVLMETPEEYREEIEGYYVHPRYDRATMVNDICVANIKSKLTMPNVAIVKLPDGKSKSSDMTKVCNQDGLAMGWGLNEKKVLPGTLHCAELPIISMETCVKLYGHRSMRGLQKQTFCTLARSRKDACQGDSGGPLLCGDLQIGIVSWGKHCGVKDEPGVFVRTDYYTRFIDKVIKKEFIRTEDDEASTSLRSTPLFKNIYSSCLYILFTMIKYIVG